MRKLDQSVLSTILSAVLTLALLVVANRPPSATSPATPTGTPPLGGRWVSLVAASAGALTRASEGEPWGQAAAAQKLGIGAEIQTDETATVQVNFDRGAVVRMAPYTTLAIADLPPEPNDPIGRLRLVSGKIWVRLQGGGMEVETRGASAAVRGSFAEFEYRQGASDDGSDDVMVVRCLEGLCALQSQTQPLVVLGNLQAMMLTFNGQPPVEIALGPDAVEAFVQNNPDSAGLAPTLTAAAPLVAEINATAISALGDQSSQSDSGNPASPASSFNALGTPLSPASSYITVTGEITTTVTPAGTWTRTPTFATGYRSPTPIYRTITPRPTATWYIYPTPLWWGWTRTPTRVPSLTFTPTRTLTPTPTATLTPTATSTVSVTVTATPTPTPSPSATGSPTVTPTSTTTGTETPTPTETPTTTTTGTSTPTATATGTPTLTGTATETGTPTLTGTSTSTVTPTPTPTVTATPYGILVNTTADGADAAPGNGVCETGSGNGQCTLRAAIQEANSPSGFHTIILPAGTYPLTVTGSGEDAAATGDLDITGNVTIFGAGAGSTIIDASALGDRVFQVVSSTSTLQLNDVTVRNGNLASGDGGGIYNAGTLVMNDSVLTNNTAAAGQGGGLFSTGGSSATLTRVWVSANMADNGGGIAAVGDTTHSVTLDINASAITANTANSGSTAIYDDRSTVSLVNVTVSGNTNGTLPALLVASSAAGPLTLTNVTIADNYVGLSNSGGSVRVANSIFANNTSANCAGDAITSLGHNLDTATSCSLGVTGDRSSLGAGLDSLANYGGTTPTHRLQFSSPARDAGDNSLCPVMDQRGVSRPQNNICDIGAVEYLPGIDP